LWLKLFILVCRVSLRPTISHGFLAVVRPAVAPELLRAAVLTDARPAAEPVDGPQAVAAACIDVLAAVAVAECTTAEDCAAALSVSAAAAYPHYSNALPVRAAADDRHVSD